MGYGRFEDVVNALEGAVLRGEYLVGDSSTTHWRRSKPNRQLLRPKRDELNALDFDTSRHYLAYLCSTTARWTKDASRGKVRLRASTEVYLHLRNHRGLICGMNEELSPTLLS